MKRVNKETKAMAIDLVNRLFWISTFLQRTGNRNVARWGLNQSQFAVLVEVAGKKDSAQKDILGELLLEKSNLSKIISKLAEMNLIEVSVKEADKRTSVLNATPEGKALVRNCMAELDELKEKFAAPLGISKLKMILGAIDELEQLVEYQRTNG